MKTNMISTSCREGFAGFIGGFFRVTQAWLWALLLAVGAGLVVPAAHAVHPMVVLEDSYELKPVDTRWPDTASGVVLLPGCVHCKQDRYSLGINARFFIGEQRVVYSEFLEVVRRTRATAVFIAIERSTGAVSRATVMP